MIPLINCGVMRTLTIYVHIPFCVQKCGYCDFNAYLYREDLASAYLAALRQEIVHAAAERSWAATSVASVYFGGGTPSTLAPEALVELLRLIQSAFPVRDRAEITVEADPGTIDLAALEHLRGGGFNRLSIGVQAFDDRLLKDVDRRHTVAEARQALAWARRAGFWDLNMDLMFGLPGQTLAAWDHSLGEAVAFTPTHVSVYGLTIEARTPFYQRQRRGQLALPDEEVQASMFEHADARLTATGYHHYEISNYALPGWRSQHNSHYWRHGEYLGFGAGAHAYLAGRRWENERLPSRYIRAITARGTAAGPAEPITGARRVHEGLMIGLRRQEGIDLAEFMTSYAVELEHAYAAPLAELTQAGYVEVIAGRLRLTGRGRLVADAVLGHFVAAEET
jgi:oxygen-independent coproporphyrinogen III oxidase